MKLKHRLLGIFFAISLIPILLIGIIASIIASNSLEQQTFDQLTAIKENKKSQVVKYFNDRKHDLKLLTPTVQGLLDTNNLSTLNASAHAFQQYFTDYIKTNEYYDFFLISEDGQIFYTVTREADYKTNLLDGPFKDSGLGKLFRRVLETNEYSMQDFSPYEPSNGDAASFIAQPFTTSRGQKFVVALQLSIDNINKMIQQRAGMGKTGESYLVGSDYRMRSDSSLHATTHTVQKSFAGNLRQNGIQTEAVKEGLNGVSDTRIIDGPHGHPVLSGFTPINIESTRWVLVTEIETEEAFAPIDDLYNTLFGVLLFTIAVVLFAAMRTATSIVSPLGGEPEQMHHITERVADGDLTIKLDDGKAHSGIYGAMQKMVKTLHNLIGKIIDSSGTLASTAEQTSNSALQAEASLIAQKKSIEQVATAVEQMSVSVQEVAQNAFEVASATTSAKNQSNEANDMLEQTVGEMNRLGTEIDAATGVIQQLAQDSQSISSVMEVIRSIAEQTNLLALNAAIEAARAGEQGRGFAVVADEVRNLAQKTQDSTRDIEVVIEKLQTASQEAVSAMDNSQRSAEQTIQKASLTAESIVKVDSNIETISQMSELIASAAEEQSTVTLDISKSITDISDTANQNTLSAQDASKASQQISELAVNLNDISTQFKTL